MSELEDMISGVLNDPKQMEKISGLVSQLMGGDGGGEPAAGTVPGADILGKLSGIMGRAGKDDDKMLLLKAMQPYLKEHRREKMAKAIRLAQMARLAGLAFEEGLGDV